MRCLQGRCSAYLSKPGTCKRKLLAKLVRHTAASRSKIALAERGALMTLHAGISTASSLMWLIRRTRTTSRSEGALGALGPLGRCVRE